MWLFTRHGFASIVQDRGDPRRLLVRGRLAGDVERLLPHAHVQETPAADYRFRSFVPRTAVADRLATLAYEVTYPNFKETVLADHGDPYLWIRRARYFAVWNEMAAAQRDAVTHARVRSPVVDAVLDFNPFEEELEEHAAEAFIDFVAQEFPHVAELVDVLAAMDPADVVRLLSFKRPA